jgi:hypothetical protein
MPFGALERYGQCRRQGRGKFRHDLDPLLTNDEDPKISHPLERLAQIMDLSLDAFRDVSLSLSPFCPFALYERRGVPFTNPDRTRSLVDFVGPQTRQQWNNKST